MFRLRAAVPEAAIDTNSHLLPVKHQLHRHISETPLGTISSLEHVLTHLDQRLIERTADLADTERKQTDLVKHLDQPFEYSGQLDAATTRQAEIAAALDITKNQASAKLDQGVVQSPKSMEESPLQAVATKRAKTASVAV